MYFLLFIAAVSLLVGVARLRRTHRTRQTTKQQARALDALERLNHEDRRDPFAGMVQALDRPRYPPPAPSALASAPPHPVPPPPPPPPPPTRLPDPSKSSVRRHLVPAGAVPRAAALVTVLTVIAAVAVVALALTGTPGYHQAAAPTLVPPLTLQPPAPSSPPPSVTTPSDGTDFPGRPATSSISSATGGEEPVLTSISPAAGTAGQTVTLLGSHLFSPDGHISVTFGTSLATTSCPAQTTCQVVVPAPQGKTPVEVAVTTGSGTSNALAFNYT